MRLVAAASIVSLCSALLLAAERPRRRAALGRPRHDRRDHRHRPLPRAAALEGDVRQSHAVDLRRAFAGAERARLGPAQCRARARSRGRCHRRTRRQRVDATTRSECSGCCAPHAGSCALPEGTTLADQMPAELYARYAALRARHMPDADEDDEDVRPALAALRLYGAALDDTGLTTNSNVGKQIARKMRRSRAEEADVLVETGARGRARRAREDHARGRARMLRAAS